MNINEIIIRNIEETDYLNLLPLINQLGYPATQEELISNINNYLNNATTVLFVAQLNNKIIGFISIDVVQRFYLPPFADISGIAVDLNYRKSGVGKLLIDKAHCWAKQKGYSELVLKSGSSRTEAHKFYEKIGFNKIKEQYVFKSNI